MLDHSEIAEYLEKLERIEDEALAVELLTQLNEKSKKMGQLIMNQDKELSHDQWKHLCDEAKKELDAVLERIRLS